MISRELIYQYLEWGFNILPARDNAKYPVIGEWKQYQKKKYPKEEIEEYLENGHKNWLVVCGEISNNLLVVDFDNPEIYKKFTLNVPNRLLRTFIVKTGKKGYHVYYRTPEPIKSTKMDKIDIQGEGKLAMVPPSIHPETGKMYEIENSEEPLKLSQEELESIIYVCEEITGKTAPEEFLGDKEIPMKIVRTIIPYWKEGQRNNLEWPLLGYMRKHGIPYNTAKYILDKIISLTGDNERNMRMAVLKRNYKLSLQKLKGYTQLKEFLREEDLKLLEKYVKALSGENKENVEKNAKEEEKKKERIKKVPYIDLEDDLYLAVWDGKDNYKFAHLSRNGEIELLDKVEIDGEVYLPREKKEYFRSGNPSRIPYI